MKFLVPMTVLSVIHLAGCATTVDSPDATASPVAVSAPEQIASLTLIARDFVNAISQLQGLPAAFTTIELDETDRADPFTRAMQSEFQNAGYATRWIQDEKASALFEYRHVSEKAAALTLRDTYELAVGKAELRRSYATDQTGRVQPITPLFVRGIDATGLVLNDTIFQGPGPATAGQQPDLSIGSAGATEVVSISAVPLKSTAEPHIDPRRTPISRRLPPDASPLNSAVDEALSKSSKPPAFTSTPRAENVFELGGSNFADLLSDHDVVKEQVLTFANDSMRLGSRNKRLVDQLVAQYQPSTDVFTVIGCSMGATAVRGGNAALALGRAGRVAEALRFAGVASDHIFDEGCWAGNGALNDLPRRGVVLTLNRRD